MPEFPPGFVAQEGARNDHVRSFNGRPVPDHGQAVAVYRDLSGAPKSGYPARGSWSIKTLSERGGKSPHVQAHTVGLHIKNARPVFDNAAREFFKNEEKRGVHAYIGGHVHQYRPPEPPEGDDWEPVSYYPDISEFFTKHDRLPYHGSDEFVFAGGQAFARGNIRKGEAPVPLSKFEQPRTSGWRFSTDEPSWEYRGWRFHSVMQNVWKLKQYLKEHPEVSPPANVNFMSEAEAGRYLRNLMGLKRQPKFRDLSPENASMSDSIVNYMGDKSKADKQQRQHQEFEDLSRLHNKALGTAEWTPQPDNPDNHGRGIITEDGQVHTWPQEHGSHWEWLEKNGMAYEPEKQSLFSINPSGEVEDFMGQMPEHHRALIDQHPRLRYPQAAAGGGDWDFGGGGGGFGF